MRRKPKSDLSDSFSGKHIRIYPANSQNPNVAWRVDSKKDGHEIAYIEWYPKWRCYVLAPLIDTVYEHVCLRDLSNFIEVANGHLAKREVWPRKGER